MGLPAKTPAMTARKDLLKNSLKKLQVDRYRKVEKRGREIALEMAQEEGLHEKWRDPSQRDDVMRRFQELVAIGNQQADQELPPAELPPEARMVYHRARMLKGRMNIWRATGKEKFEDELEESAEKAREAVVNLKELIAFLKEAKPSIADYTGEEGKTEFDDSDVQKTHYDSGVIVMVKESEAYGSITRGFDSFIRRLTHSLNELEEELEEYEDDPVGDIIDAAQDLGLVQVYEDSDDGFLWFQDEDTEHLYYFVLVGQKFDVRTMYDASTVREDNWKANWGNPLNLYLGGNKAAVYGDDPARVCRDYFGVWNGIRRFVKQSVDNGNRIPACLPTEYVESGIKGR